MRFPVKKRTIFLVIILLLLLVSVAFYSDQYLHIKYDVSLLEYIKLSSPLTLEESELLSRFPHLIYGGNISEPPMGIYYPEINQHVGLVSDYLSALSIQIGKNIITEPMVWSEALEALERGRTDLCDMIPSAERGRVFAFSKPLYDLKGIAVVPVGSPIDKLEHLSEKKVGVQRGDIAIEELAERGVFPEYVYTDDSLLALELLHGGAVDAVVGDEPVIWYHFNELKNWEDYRILPDFIYQKSCAIAVSQKNADLLPIFNKGILQLRRKGIFDQIERKWLGGNIQLFNTRSEGRSKLEARLNLLFLFWGGFFVYLLNRGLVMMVSHRTRELSAVKDELQIAFDAMAPFLIVLSTTDKILNVNEAFSLYAQKSKSHLIGSLYKTFPLLLAVEETVIDETGLRLTQLEQDVKIEISYAMRRYVAECYPLPSDYGSNRGLLMILSDVTESREKTEKLSHANKMAAVGSLVAGVAHELRNPLGVIRNAAFLLSEEEDRLLPPADKYAVEVINEALGNANKTIDSLLDFSRMTYGEASMFHLADMLEESLSYLKPEYYHRGIKLILSCHEKRKICSYPNSLRHILLNLVQNAADAMPEGGNIKVTASIENKEGLHMLRLCVCDEGEGIAEHMISRIFEPFFTTKPAGKGTGLGLYIVYSELQKLKGEVNVRNNKPKGMTFELMIPLEGEAVSF